jgi:CTP:molybdopterin cytidylyltransferase MocA
LLLKVIKSLTAILMLGPEGPSPAERWVAGGRLAAARDAVDLAASIRGVGRIVVAAPEADYAGAFHNWGVSLDYDRPLAPFHFGRRLAELLAAYPAEGYLYLGAGSVPLLPAEVLAHALNDVSEAAQPLAVTNNLHSSDWMVFNCPAAIQARPDRLDNDNALGWVLRTEGGIEVRSLPPNAGTRLDIDTPADLLMLGLHPGLRPELRRYLTEQPGDRSRWLAAGRRLFAAGGQVALLGRVSAGVWAHVEANTQAWVRVFSEERGMMASGRLAAGQVKSMVGAYLLRLGPAAFFDELSGLTQAALFDNRVVLAHARHWATDADRFASDLGWADEIHDDWLRALTVAALAAPIPIVMGGHGVVTGDLYGLVEIARSGALTGAP